MYKTFLFIFLANFFTFSAQAQQYYHADQSLPCLDKEFTIVAHIMRDSLGGAAHDSTSIRQAIQNLNPLFEPICASFVVCEFVFHNNFQYAKLSGSSDPKWDEMQVKYHKDNRINMYFVSDLGGSEAGFAGLGSITDMTGSGIVIKDLGAIPHEMGHFFGLLHTFEGNGVELVDGSNCTTAGDLVCDTPADPFIPGGDSYVKNCIFIGQQQDANGEYYVPDVGNIMSYYPDECRCDKFTSGQYKRMANTYLSSSPKMW